MFERFTTEARAAVTAAVAHADGAGAPSVTDEHLLPALLDRRSGRAASVAASLGLTGRRAAVETDLAAARRRGGPTRADADALAGIGVDVDAIVARVEEAHGTGVLDRPRRTGGMRHRPFDRGAKDVLARALRIALGRQDRRIGDEHILLALTARPGAVADVLAAHGATYETVDRALHGGGGEGGEHGEDGEGGGAGRMRRAG
ncbi:Clp protease N-terminal domain-containing protein [Streptomyces sp. NPDC014735]|uniref:Clp protease N-terminal domain-containing protein n=1 Tax=unclassified Streptomyces TaxID=2593676 RepID=UPI0036FFF059